jgi:hypothetical protein
LLLVLAGLTLTVVPGCSSVVKQVIAEGRGAKAELMPLRPVATRELSGFQGVSFSPARTELPPSLCPPRLLSEYDREAARRVEKLAKHFPGGEPALTVDTDVLYFQEKSLFGSAECLTRVKLRSGGSLVVDALVRAESRSFRAGDEEGLAKACVRAVYDFLLDQKGVKQEDKAKVDSDSKERE